MKNILLALMFIIIAAPVNNVGLLVELASV